MYCLSTSFQTYWIQVFYTQINPLRGISVQCLSTESSLMTWTGRVDMPVAMPIIHPNLFLGHRCWLWCVHWHCPCQQLKLGHNSFPGVRLAGVAFFPLSVWSVKRIKGDWYLRCLSAWDLPVEAKICSQTTDWDQLQGAYNAPVITTTLVIRPFPGPIQSAGYYL